MSYNVDNIKILEGELWIAVADADAIKEEMQGDCPEGFFLDDYNRSYCLEEPNDDGFMKIKVLLFHGEWSGYSHDRYFAKILSVLHGTAKIMEIWEGGDTVEMYTLIDGKKTDIVKY